MKGEGEVPRCERNTSEEISQEHVLILGFEEPSFAQLGRHNPENMQHELERVRGTDLGMNLSGM